MTKEELNILLKDEKRLVVLCLSTKECPPCKKIKPILEEIKNEMSDNVSVLKLDAEDDWEITNLYGCRNVPLTIFIKDTKELRREVGMMSKVNIINIIKSLL